MVKIMENPIKMDDLGVPPLFLETPISNTLPETNPASSPLKMDDWKTMIVSFWGV